MIIVLKIILLLIAIADIIICRITLKDFISVRKNDGYDNLSIWEKIKFSTVFYFLLMALVSLFTFLAYFIIIPIQII